MTDPRAPPRTSPSGRRDDERVFEDDYRPVHLWVVDVASRAADAGDRGRRSSPSAGACRGRRQRPRGVRGRRHAAAARWPARRLHRADRTKAVEKICPTSVPIRAPASRPTAAVAYLSEPVTAPPIGDGTPRGTIGHSRLMLYDVASQADPRRHRQPGRRSRPAALERRRPRACSSPPATAPTPTPSSSISPRDAPPPLTTRRTLQLGSFSADGSRVAFTMDSPTAPAEVFVADAAFAAPLSSPTPTRRRATSRSATPKSSRGRAATGSRWKACC